MKWRTVDGDIVKAISNHYETLLKFNLRCYWVWLSRFAGGLALLSLAVSLAFMVKGYVLFQATIVLCCTISLIGLNLLTGYNSQISLGQAAFYAIGAYTAAILMDKLG
jgi:ABC-type branched-subunit amino acid transport system permease subunit